jgi:tRNA threonylcarbamoyladenosine biosynthesis protein TsaB
MILLLDTSTPVCKLSLVDGEWRYDDQWQADRQLAKGLLRYIYEQLQENGKSWSDITAIGAFKGPGSFTGLRIGLTVLNTLADSQGVPIVGAEGEDWQAEAIRKIQSGTNEKIVLPNYGAAANITTPRK